MIRPEDHDYPVAKYSLLGRLSPLPEEKVAHIETIPSPVSPLHSDDSPTTTLVHGKSLLLLRRKALPPISQGRFPSVLPIPSTPVYVIDPALFTSLSSVLQVHRRLLGWLPMGFPPPQRPSQQHRTHEQGTLQLQLSHIHHFHGSSVFSLFDLVWFYYRKARLLACRQFALACRDRGHRRFHPFTEICFHALELPEKHGVRPPSPLEAEHDLGEARTLHS